jgi:hypothetical protein
VRRGGIRTLKEASSGTFHRALRRPYAKVLRLPIPPRARGTKYRPTRASYNRAPPQPSPPIVTSRPPHRSVLAAFPHTVPTLGIHGSDMLPYANQHGSRVRFFM